MLTGKDLNKSPYFADILVDSQQWMLVDSILGLIACLWCLLINFCKIFWPYKAQQACSKLFDTLMEFLKEFCEEVYLEKNQQMTKKHEEIHLACKA